MPMAAATGGAILLLTKPATSIYSGQKHRFPFRSPSFNSQFSSRTIINEITGNSQRDSNVDSGRSQNFKYKFIGKKKQYRDNDAVKDDDNGGRGKGKKRRWWSDKPRYMEEEEEEAPNSLEEFVDSLWIFKLSKFYGWTLPPMIISALIATGPKAFLMALALPVGHSVISFVFQKLTRRPRSKPKHRARKRGRPFVSYPGNVGSDEEEEEEEEGRKETAVGNVSWVVSDNGSVKKDDFGGWDELERTESAQRRLFRKASQNRSKPSTNGKLGKRRGERDALIL